VTAIASRDGAKAREAAARLGIEKSYGSYEALVADLDIDAVYIPLPNHLHVEWIRKAADAGKHVLCEKPLAMSAPEARAAFEYCASRGVTLMEAFMYRLHPQWIRAKRVVEYGDIGKPLAIHSFFSYSNSDPANIRNVKDYGGGALPDIGCYAVSSARYLFGKEPRRAIALLRFDEAFGTDVLSSAVLDFGDERALFTVSTQAFPEQRVEVLGSAGSLEIPLPFNADDDVPMEIRVRKGTGSRLIREGPADQYALQFDSFARAVAGEAPLPVSPEDTVANQAVLDALFRSAREGGWAVL
jgi:predicted dehydrogenase